MGEIDLLALLRGRAPGLESDLETTGSPAFGVTLGVVTGINDPKGLGRVRVRLPWLSQQVESSWARIATAWAGQHRGSYLLPEVDDEVLVAFRHGDVSYPYILGFLWSEKSPPPQSSPRQERRELRSRRGSAIVFDDTQGKESITVRSPGGREVAVDDGANEVRIADRKRTVEIVVSTAGSGKISITAKTGDLNLSAPAGEVSIEGLRVSLKGNTIDLKPPPA